MKPVIIVMALVSTNAMAIDFETEWAKFQSDFTRMKGVQVSKVETKPVAPERAIVTPIDQEQPKVLPAMPTQENVLEQVDPKSPDRLGYKLNDPAMRDKMAKLYKKPDTVVYSLTLTE